MIFLNREEAERREKIFLFSLFCKLIFEQNLQMKQVEGFLYKLAFYDSFYNFVKKYVIAYIHELAVILSDHTANIN